MKKTGIMLLPLLSVCLLLWGCSKTVSGNAIASESRTTDVGAANLSDYVSDFRLVPLETSDSIMVGAIGKIKKRNDAMYVLADGRLLKFSLSGKYEGEMVHQGEGPEEVLAICDFDVMGDRLYILAPGKILVKDPASGELTATFELPQYVGWGQLRPAGKNLMVIAQHPAEGQNAVMLLNPENGEISSELLPVGKDWELSKTSELVELEDSRYIHQYGGSNDLCLVDVREAKTDSIQLVGSSDSADRKEYSERKLQSTGKGDMGMEIYLGLVGSKSHLFWGGLNGEKMRFFLYDKNSKKTLVFPGDQLTDDLSWAENIMQNNMIGYLSFNESDDNSFISVAEPSELKDAIEGKELKFADAYKVLEGIGEDANPIVVFIDFKPIE